MSEFFWGDDSCWKIPMQEFFWGDDSCWEIPNSGNLVGDQNEGKKPVVEAVEAVATNTKSPTLRTEEAGPSSPMVSKKRSKKSAGEELKDKKLKGKSRFAAGPSSADHDLHIFTERERRKKMRSMFSNLHALLPHLPPKADKSTIVHEAVSYIKKSEELLEKLEKQKHERRLIMQGTAIISCYGGSPSLNMNSARNKLLLSPMDSSNAREAFQLFSPLNFPRTNNYPPATAQAPAPATFSTWVSPNVVVSISGENAHINVCCVKTLGLLTAISLFLEKHSLEAVSIQISSDHYRCMYMIHARPSRNLKEFIAHGILSVDEKFQQAAAEIMTFINSM